MNRGKFSDKNSPWRRSVRYAERVVQDHGMWGHVIAERRTIARKAWLAGYAAALKDKRT